MPKPGRLRPQTRTEIARRLLAEHPGKKFVELARMHAHQLGGYTKAARILRDAGRREKDNRLITRRKPVRPLSREQLYEIYAGLQKKLPARARYFYQRYAHLFTEAGLGESDVLEKLERRMLQRLGNYDFDRIGASGKAQPIEKYVSASLSFQCREILKDAVLQVNRARNALEQKNQIKKPATGTLTAMAYAAIRTAPDKKLKNHPAPPDVESKTWDNALRDASMRYFPATHANRLSAPQADVQTVQELVESRGTGNAVSVLAKKGISRQHAEILVRKAAGQKISEIIAQMKLAISPSRISQILRKTLKKLELQ